MLAYLRGPDLVCDWITDGAGRPFTIVFLPARAFAIIVLMPIVS